MGNIITRLEPEGASGGRLLSLGCIQFWLWMDITDSSLDISLFTISVLALILESQEVEMKDYISRDGSV